MHEGGTEGMRDTIDRQAAIETAIEAADEWDGGYNEERERVIRGALEALPSTQQWIPCSERLPENPKSNVDIKTYIVCFDDGNITDLMWCDGWNCCFNSKGTVSKENELTGVIAWMPLPEPYQEGK